MSVPAPTPRPLCIAYYCSGHGYGHATRVSALTRHLLDLPAEDRPTVHIVSSAPAHIFADSTERGAIYRHAEIDPVVVQPLAYSVDRERSVAALRRFLEQKDAKLAVERDWLANTVHADCVLSDAAFLGCLAAKEAGIPAILVTNFTFDSVYSWLATTTSDNSPTASSARASASPRPPPQPQPHGQPELEPPTIDATLTSNPNSNSNPNPNSTVTPNTQPEPAPTPDPEAPPDTPIPHTTLAPLVSQIHAGYRAASMLLLLPGSIPIPSFSDSFAASFAHRLKDTDTDTQNGCDYDSGYRCNVINNLHGGEGKEGEGKRVVVGGEERERVLELPATKWIDEERRCFKDEVLELVLVQHGRRTLAVGGADTRTSTSTSTSMKTGTSRNTGTTTGTTTGIGTGTRKGSTKRRKRKSKKTGPTPPVAKPQSPKPEHRPIIPTPLLVRPPSSAHVYTPQGRRDYLTRVIGVPEHVLEQREGEEVKVLVVSFGGQVIKKPGVGVGAGKSGHERRGASGGVGNRSGGGRQPLSALSSLASSSATLVDVEEVDEKQRVRAGSEDSDSDSQSDGEGGEKVSLSSPSPLSSSLSLDSIQGHAQPDSRHQGHEREPADATRTFLPDDTWIAIMCGMAHTEQDELPERFFVAPKDVYMPDLMAVGDVLLGKLGYGTVSECVDACTAFVYVSRPLFIEEHGLRLLLTHQGVGVELSRSAYEAGDWASAVEEAWGRAGGREMKLRKRRAMEGEGGEREVQRKREEGRELARFVVGWARTGGVQDWRHCGGDGLL